MLPELMRAMAYLTVIVFDILLLRFAWLKFTDYRASNLKKQRLEMWRYIRAKKVYDRLETEREFNDPNL